MDDILCVVCGEPYDAYYVHHEMDATERERLLAGKGCECCKGIKPEGRTENDRFTAIAHNVLESENPDAVLEGLGL